MEQWGDRLCTAFEGSRCIASGKLSTVALKVKKIVDRGERAPVLIFEDATSEQIEVDFRGTALDVSRKLSESPSAGPPSAPDGERSRGPGRPRLGVVAREVTLLPRHWEWLNSQPGGASVALCKLVEEARRDDQGKYRLQRSQEVAYRFMSAMAGNLPGFEEAARALFARERARFDALIRRWPKDIREHLARLAARCLEI